MIYGKLIDWARRMRISSRLSLFVGLTAVAIVSCMSAVVISMTTKAQTQVARENTKSTAQACALQMGSQLNDAMATVRGVAYSFEGMKLEGRTSRSAADAMLKQVLQRCPYALGVWTCWEPNAFDGSDARYAGTEGSDKTGRYIPYFNRGSGSVVLEALMDYEKPGAGDYYLLAKRSGEETVVPPYSYKVAGKDVLITSVAVPITDNGQFVGVVGMDLALDTIQAAAKEIKPGGTGYVTLVSHDGSYVACSDTSMLGKSMKKEDGSQRIMNAADTGATAMLERRSDQLRGERVLTVAAPIRIGASKTPWSAVVNVPVRTTMAGVNSLRTVCIAITLIAVVLLVVTTSLISGRMLRPLARLRAVADTLATGDVNVSLDTSAQDEIGDLSRAMSSMVDGIQGQTNAAERIAAGDMSVHVDVRSDADVLNKAMAKVAETLRGLVAETGMLAAAAVEGRLGTRGDAAKFDGGYREIVQGVNNAIDSLVGHLDAMPAPAMIIDKDFTIQYMNDAGAGVIGLDKKRILGTKCYDNFKTSDCKTADCACARAMQQAHPSSSETDAHPNGLDLEISYTGVPIKDSSGNVIGAFEVVTDNTAQVKAARLMQKIADFQGAEVAKLVDSLGSLAQGDLDFVLQVADGDDDTAEARTNFERIGQAVNQSVDAVKQLASDIGMLSAAAVEGRLDTRADASQHHGDFARIVDGVNQTLDSVIDPINEAAAILERLAANDLTARMEGDYQGDHAKIKESLNTAMETLQSAVRQVAEASGKVSASAQSLSSTSEEVGKSSQQVAETIGQVAIGSQEQSRTVQSSATAMEQLTRAIQEIAQGAQSQAKTVENTVELVQQSAMATEQVAKLSQDATDSGREVAGIASAGGQQVADAVGSMGRIKEATDQVAGVITKLGESSQQIGAIVETINDIAEQTNLLALNAAIEAARAGEHGKGFAVVADEVRKLAERSSKATGEIGELITSIQGMTSQAVEAMDRGSRQVEEGAEMGNQAGEALVRIQEAVAGIVQQIEYMSSASQEMSASSLEVIKAIENVSAITEETTAAAEEMSASSTEVVQQIEQVAAVSEQNASAAQEVSATTEEQNAAVEEMSAAAEDLARMSGDLQELVSQFKLDDDVAIAVRSTKPAGRKPAGAALRKAA